MDHKKVIILATGGTIAGTGAAGMSVGYMPGQLSVDTLLSEIPHIEEKAQVEAHQICNVNSDDISAPIWLELAKTVNQEAARSDVDGIVITHGTDTMDETAYLLNLVVKTSKPVVLTGSMRPNTATSADGPMNLYQAIVAAAAPESRDRGVLVVFSGRIFSARDVQKTSTHCVTAMSGGEGGCCGVIRDDEVFYASTSSKLHTHYTEFDVDDLVSLPKVTVLYFNVDADPRMVAYAASISDGLVIAGAGAGEFSKGFVTELEKVNVPVVISSRVGSGLVMEKALLCSNGIAANDLPPQKAAILLRLALTKTIDQQAIARMFEVY